MKKLHSTGPHIQLMVGLPIFLAFMLLSLWGMLAGSIFMLVPFIGTLVGLIFTLYQLPLISKAYLTPEGLRLKKIVGEAKTYLPHQIEGVPKPGFYSRGVERVAVLARDEQGVLTKYYILRYRKGLFTREPGALEMLQAWQHNAEKQG